MVLSALVLILAVALALALAWLPMQLLMSQMAKRVTAFIQRQRERRRDHRNTPERRKAPIV
jgi:hypothetical protein